MCACVLALYINRYIVTSERLQGVRGGRLLILKNAQGSGSDKFDRDTDETIYLVLRENPNLRFNYRS